MLIPISLLHKTTKKVRGFPGFSEKSRTFLFSFHPPVSHTAPSKQPFTYHIPPYCTKIIVEIRYDKIDLPLRVHPAILKCFRDISQHNTFLFALGGDRFQFAIFKESIQYLLPILRIPSLLQCRLVRFLL